MTTTTQKVAYFVQRTQTDVNGEYIACIAKEGEKGYFLTDWTWGKDYAIAEQCANEKNAKMGLSEFDALKIICSTM